MEEIKQLLESVLAPIIERSVAKAVSEKVANKDKAYPANVGVDTAAEITGYSRNSLYQMHSRGQVPGAFRCGGKLLFKSADLLKWVESGRNIK